MSLEADVAIAVLQTNYTHLSEKIGEVQTETRAFRAEVGGKLDTVLNAIATRKATDAVRNRIIAAASHFATGSITLAAVKLLHIPLNLG